MPANRLRRPKSRQQLSTGSVIGDDIVGRHLTELADAQEQLDAKVSDRISVTVSLVVGANRVVHGLGRRASGATVTPTVADATFAWAFSTDGDRVAIITVVGVAQPKATVEVW